MSLQTGNGQSGGINPGAELEQLVFLKGMDPGDRENQ